MDKEWDMLSELEKMVALDMLLTGYDHESFADVNEYWTEIIAQWNE